jgi:hypothetical protein
MPAPHTHTHTPTHTHPHTHTHTQRYIGSSRDVGLALRAHVKVQGRKAVAGVAVQSFRFPKREEVRACMHQ